MHLSGSAVAGLEPFDQLLTSFAAEHAVPATALAVGRAGKLLYARSAGWADAARRVPAEPHALFRIASLSKPITAVAILQQVEPSALLLEARVWELLKLDEPKDPRWKQVTIQHLLQHSGGWDRSVSFDPMFRSIEFAKEAGVAPPAGPKEIIRAMLQRTLDFEPGERYAYSNFGYCLLGRVLEALPTANGRSYEQIVRDEVFAPVQAYSPVIGHTLTTHLDEVHYSMPEIAGQPPARSPSVFTVGEQVAPPYGEWHLEAMDAHGGWLSTAADLVRFAMGCDESAREETPPRVGLLARSTVDQMFAAPTGWERSDPDFWYGMGWNVRRTDSGTKRNTWHMGALDGTSTLLVRRADGLSWAVLFNQRKNTAGEELARLIDPLVHQAANSSHWE